MGRIIKPFSVEQINLTKVTGQRKLTLELIRMKVQHCQPCVTTDAVASMKCNTHVPFKGGHTGVLKVPPSCQEFFFHFLFFWSEW